MRARGFSRETRASYWPSREYSIISLSSLGKHRIDVIDMSATFVGFVFCALPTLVVLGSKCDRTPLLPR